MDSDGYWLMNLSHNATHLVLVLLLGRPLQKSPMLRRFQTDRDEIWKDCSSIKYTLFSTH